MKAYYEFLNIREDASEEEIIEAYLEKMNVLHSNIHSEPEEFEKNRLMLLEVHAHLIVTKDEINVDEEGGAHERLNTHH